ncbi:FadR/GntR family transcriptional regulator [Kineosporia sp. R_H_3]|uniref:FadR/GntR family transcriptional regulator n=1 Tax=Kineosporia sp. R_H_3 TaxID=1961848 RepID=UPI000B4A6D64|nr:GntR family transcriptional regulator [Kineosporia sp. R_H_3]
MAVGERVSARTAVFAPLTSGGRAEAVVQRITESASLGLLADGEQLPSETELAAQLGVSTVTLREALASLREQGLVETRRGRNGGSFIRAPGDPTKTDLRARLSALSVSDLRDAGDELASVSGAAARLAASRASTDNVRRLLALAERIGAAAGVGDRTRADSRFHIEVAVSAASERLTRSEVSLQGELGLLLWGAASAAGHAAESAEQHRAIALAISREDAGLARDLAERHVEQNMHRLIEARIELHGGGGRGR